jgi:hypothetical protein
MHTRLIVIVLFVLAALITLTIVSRRQHQRSLNFLNMVYNHSCKLVEYWEDGSKKIGNLCIQPDGRIIKTSGFVPIIESN